MWVEKIWKWLGWWGALIVALVLGAVVNGVVATFATTGGTRFAFGLAGYVLVFLLGVAVGRKVAD